MLYPPILASTQAAFDYTTHSYEINFELQDINALDEIGHVQVKITFQSNNQTPIKTTPTGNFDSYYPDGILYLRKELITKNKYSSGYNIAIRGDMFQKGAWEPGQLYKIQIRFGKNDIYTIINEFADWKQQQINEKDALSEWSTVMIIKPIKAIETQIINNVTIANSFLEQVRTEFTLTPLIYGKFTLPEENKEPVEFYKFNLYKSTTTNLTNANAYKQIETSNWILQNSTTNSSQYRFKTQLINEETYMVEYRVLTVNGYESTPTRYTFKASLAYLDDIPGLTIQTYDDTPTCIENGCIQIYGDALNDHLSGTYVIARTSEQSNYTLWEDIAYLNWFSKELSNDLLYTDYTIESGIRYKYSIQMENKVGLRTKPIYSDSYCCVNFEYSYLYRDGVQLKLKFNQTMNSFKHSTLRAKQDTLGDKYPHLVQNGNAYYAEFPVQGLISIQMDEEDQFINKRSDGYYYKDELIIPNHKFEFDEWTVNQNLTYDNYFIERKFREKVEEFLNDFEYKLYKSPTEGNMIIGLMNVSLTPNASLGRLLFNFTATAYEVAEVNLANLNTYGIINIGEYETLDNNESIPFFGQVSAIYGMYHDIYAMIKKQEEVEIGGGYRYALKHITSIWIEQYPKIDLSNDIRTLEAERAAALQAGEDATQITDELYRLEMLDSVLEHNPESVTAKFEINGATVILVPNRVYNLEGQEITSLKLIDSDWPVLVNYTCDMRQAVDSTKTWVRAVYAINFWGQLAGVFTETDEVLRFYNYDYENYSQVFNDDLHNFTIKDSFNQIIQDSTEYHVFSTQDITYMIEEDVIRQLQVEMNQMFKVEKYDTSRYQSLVIEQNNISKQITIWQNYINALDKADPTYTEVQSILRNLTKKKTQIARQIAQEKKKMDEAAELVEESMNKKFTNKIWQTSTANWEFEMLNLVTVEIEADPGTSLLIGDSAANYTEVIIGESGRYNLGPMEEMVKYICLSEPQYCIVNYRVQASLKELTKDDQIYDGDF